VLALEHQLLGYQGLAPVLAPALVLVLALALWSDL
jgi:hypothetical protein